MLTGENKKKHSLEIVYSDKKKRYTEFYRIRVKHTSASRHTHYWIRIVKNKPEEVIYKALEKQYGIMDQLFRYFSRHGMNGKIRLSCSKPVALIKRFHTVITRECSGTLFNRYLKGQFPLLNQKEILTHCYNCGLWLYHFHQCFKQNPKEPVFEALLAKFRAKFNRLPDNSLAFITFCHNDYSPRNIFVDKNLIEVIDFVGVETGFPEEDLNFFRNYILKARFNFLYPLKFRKKMVDEFLMGYESGK
jgi:hypothetical protein